MLLIKQSKCTKYWNTFVSHCIYVEVSVRNPIVKPAHHAETTTPVWIPGPCRSFRLWYGSQVPASHSWVWELGTCECDRCIEHFTFPSTFLLSCCWQMLLYKAFEQYVTTCIAYPEQFYEERWSAELMSNISKEYSLSDSSSASRLNSQKKQSSCMRNWMPPDCQHVPVFCHQAAVCQGSLQQLL